MTVEVFTWSQSTSQGCTIAIKLPHLPVANAGILVDAMRELRTTEEPKVIISSQSEDEIPIGIIRCDENGTDNYRPYNKRCIERCMRPDA
jgi:hypothetical protein